MIFHCEISVWFHCFLTIVCIQSRAVSGEMTKFGCVVYCCGKKGMRSNKWIDFSANLSHFLRLGVQLGSIIYRRILPYKFETFAMHHILKLHSIPKNPACDSVVNPKFLSHFEAQPHITATLGIHLQPHLQAAGIDVEGISNDSLLTDVSPWSMPVPVVRFDLTKLKQYKQLFLELNSFLCFERWGSAYMHTLWSVMFYWTPAHNVCRLDRMEKAIF